jgi:hypothetical protein
MFNKVTRLSVGAFALLSLAVLGCGGDGPVAPGLGNGSVTVTGAVSTSGNGLALFQSVTTGGTSLFQMVIAPLTQSAVIWELQIANYSGRPATGTYNLSPLSASSSEPTASFYYTSGGTMQFFTSTSGQLVITASSPTRVAGTFTFSATDASVGGAGSVTVTGTFSAQCAPGTACQ